MEAIASRSFAATLSINPTSATFPGPVIELAQSGRLDFLSAMLFPSTCDVIRNLSGMWQVLYPELYVRYVDLPQIEDPVLAHRFWRGELATLLVELSDVSGRPADDSSLRAAIQLHNEARQMTRALYQTRRDEPWRVSTEELYLLIRAGEVVPAEIYIDKVRKFLAAVSEDPGQIKDKSRVVVVGSFCEQPPLGLIKTIERAGCYIVDDDFLIGNRLLTEDVKIETDALDGLATSLIRGAAKTSVLYEPDPAGKKELMTARVKAARADGIIFAAASFCDPALLDRPMLRAGAEANDISVHRVQVLGEYWTIPAVP